MEIYSDLETLPRNADNVLTVGTFDGVHLGHRFILTELKKIAHSIDGIPAVVTFDPHPRLVINQDRQPIKLLTTIDEKIPLFQSLGVERLVIIPFTKAFSQIAAEEYVRKILHERIGLKGMVVGYDHAFGHNREGGMQTLRHIASDLNFEVIQLKELRAEGAQVSSTEIRTFLENGEIRAANARLGYAYTVIGKVIKGDGRGKLLGFPTANIYISKSAKLLPANGVYAVKAEVNGTEFLGMSNIGIRPTFDGNQHVFEVHLFDFDEDIYDRQIRVSFCDKIRNEKKFDSPQELIQQLNSDKIKTLQILNRA